MFMLAHRMSSSILESVEGKWKHTQDESKDSDCNWMHVLPKGLDDVAEISGFSGRPTAAVQISAEHVLWAAGEPFA